MFKRKRSQRVHPDELVQDAYIQRRYEDLSICIHRDIKNGKGQYNYYAPWLEIKLQSFPADYRENHSVLQQPVDASQPETPHSHSKNSVFTKSPVSMSVANCSMGISPKTAWVEVGEKAEESGPSVSTDIHVNRTLPFDNSGNTSKHIEDVKYANSQREEGRVEIADKVHCSAESISRHVSFGETVTERERQKVDASAKEVGDYKQDDRNQRPDTSTIQQSSSIIRRRGRSTSSKICTIL